MPTGIATDDSTKEFFGDLVTRNNLVSCYDFENREAIFSGVHRSYKFSLLTMGHTREPTRFLFFASNVAQLADAQRAFSLTPAEVALINPNTRTAPVFRTAKDAELTKKLYRNAPVLLNERTGANSWGLSFRQGLFNMASDSHLFQTAPGEGLLPLYEAKLLHQYTHRWASYANSPQKHKGTEEEGGARALTPAELADPSCSITPRYWVDKLAVEERIPVNWQRRWTLGWRDICRSTDERTLIAAIAPTFGFGDTFLLMFPSVTNAISSSCLLATLNSFSLDFITRQKVAGTHLKYFTMKQLPVLPPSAFSEADIAFIVPRVVELVYTAWDIKAFAEDVWAEGDEALRVELLRRNAECNAGAPAELFSPRDGFPLPPYRWNEERRAIARAELDARIARLYGLTRDELRYILDPADVYGPEFPGETFRVLKEKETKLYGEYRTRRLVLEAWDREDGL